tara:strand:- start:218 stop:865 length:648 start_codon:yes stop_codon:yes gene_type:complete
MTEFEKYVKSDYGVNSTTLYDYKNSMTPMVIEEREMRAVSMSVFDRLMMERIIWCAGPVNDRMSIIVQAQLMFLNSLSHEDITIHVDTPGGSVKSGLGIVDVMDYIDCEIATVNTGMAASMGSILLGAGTKGKRSSLRFSKTMLHQSSGGAIGNIQDARITMNEWEKTNDILFELLGDYCGKDPKQVMEDATRDNWLTAQEALDYGIIDEVIGLK